MRIQVIDAFTDRPFAGNPAVVCLLDSDSWPDEAWMQRIAAELNVPGTAFGYPLPDGDWALRWFTPTIEITLCGHATLATAHALHTDRGVRGPIRFRTVSGVLVADVADDGAITLDFPAANVSEVPIPDGLVEALGAKPDSTHHTGVLRDLLCVLPDEASVRALAPDVSAMTRLTRRDNIRGVVATSAADPGTGYDFVSRFFSPGDGLAEDPVTGSAHTALAPFWADRLGAASLTGLQASARTGLVRTVVRGDRVLISGRAVTMLDGQLTSNSLPPGPRDL
jgi:PhzF family phenazine biosynthesis protein